MVRSVEDRPEPRMGVIAMGKVKYNQPGYVGCSMSVNAVLAYLSGEKPKSKWTKSTMLDAIASYCDSFGIPYDGSAASYKADVLFDKFFEWKSWHHTGKYANATDFYGLDEEAVTRFFESRAVA